MENRNVIHKLEHKDFDFTPYNSAHSGDKTIAYKIFEGEEVRMSFFFPENYSNKNKYPTIIYIHGGGWSGHHIFDDQDGWQGDYYGFMARYHSTKGFLGISIDYRLEKEHADNYQIIDCCDDCFEACDYILDRAEEYGVDTDNVYVLGESAGGHLAGLLATDYKREGFKFKGAFLGNPVLYFENDPDFSMIPSSSKHPVWSKMDPKDYAKSISPRYHITKDTAPCILIHGAADTVVSPNHSITFYNAMTTEDLDCELHLIEDTNHAFMLSEFTDNQDACRISIEIVDDRLRRDGNLK